MQISSLGLLPLGASSTSQGGRFATVRLRGNSIFFAESTADALRMGVAARTISLSTVALVADDPKRCASIPPIENRAHRQASSKASHLQRLADRMRPSKTEEADKPGMQPGSRNPVRAMSALPLCSVRKARERLVANFMSVRTNVTSAWRRYEVISPNALSAAIEATHVASRMLSCTLTASGLPVERAATSGSRSMYEHRMCESVTARIVTCPESGRSRSTRLLRPGGGVK
mmetsp:Transcript_9627/g.29314  ORF Transcript_9627/g.29314 Transcript_9627/m.29314 type:complete len:231 (-) Transcript_9627:1437-2129(-)